MSLDQSHERMEAAVRELISLLDRRATTAEAVREHHSHGESYHPAGLPDVVCFPHSTEEVSAILKISAKHQVPVIPFGGGTSMEAQVNAIHGGITIDMREMNKILRISAEDLQATVEAGVSRLQLQKALRNTGFTFFIDPGADATHRRHDVDARLRHHGRPLRDDARKCDGPHGRAGRRPRDQDRLARAQIRRGLRPHAPLRGRGRHARRDHRDHAAAASAA